MSNFFTTTIIIVALSLSLTQLSEAVCTQTGNTPDGGNIIDCPGPVQTTPLNTGSNPATTTLADEINIPADGGLDTDPGPAIITSLGDDIVNISGVVISESGAAIITSLGEDRIFANNATIRSRNSAGLNVGTENDEIIVNGGSITGEGGSAMILAPGDDTVIINGANITSLTNTYINAGVGNDKITINSGNFDAFSRGFLLATGDDVLTINDGSFKTSENVIIEGGSGEDLVTLNGGIYMPGTEVSVTLDEDDDMLKLGGAVDLGGIIDCGEDFDTLIFAMGVPLNQIPQVTEAIENLSAPDGSIAINGINYTYINCEQFINEITEPVGLPIPTLSQWGLIAMAGLIGIAALITIRRKALA